MAAERCDPMKNKATPQPGRTTIDPQGKAGTAEFLRDLAAQEQAKLGLVNQVNQGGTPSPVRAEVTDGVKQQYAEKRSLT